MSFWNKDTVPWDGGDEWIVWLIAAIVATLLTHNILRAYKKNKG